MGHLRHQQKNFKTPKKIESAIPLPKSLDVPPYQEPSNPRTNTMYVSMGSTSDLRTKYSHQTGKFPLQSSKGHNYVFIL